MNKLENYVKTFEYFMGGGVWEYLERRNHWEIA